MKKKTKTRATTTKPTTTPPDRPARAVFADGTKRDPLALHPAAIGVSYPVRAAADVAQVVDGVAVICVDGPLTHKADGWWCCFGDYESLASRFVSALAGADVEAVVLKFDSPGGDVAGLFETVRLMTAAKVAAGKPVYAYVDEDCYSAAYALAMVADEIYVPPTGNVGSIGVITVMGEMTEANKKAGVRVEVITSGAQKADGHPCVELTDDAIARTQARVDELANMFFTLVSETRGIPAATVKGLEAGVRTGQAAVDAELADGVMSLQDVLTTAASMVVSARNTGDDQSPKETPTMRGLLASTKALNEANAALAAAKTDEEKEAAAAAVKRAEVKYRHVKKTVETIESEDEPEPSEDEEESDDAESAEDAEGEAAAASAPAPKHAATAAGVLALARQITGKHAIDEVMGALHALGQASAGFAKMAKRVAALESSARSKTVAALVREGLTAGKLAPAQTAWAQTQSPAALRAYLDATPPLVHPEGEAHTEAKTPDAPFGAVTPAMAKTWRALGYTEADFPALLAKLNSNGAVGVTNGAT